MAEGHNAGTLQGISDSIREAHGTATPGVWPIGGGDGITMTPVSEILDNPGELPGTQAAHDDPPNATGGRNRATRKTSPPD